MWLALPFALVALIRYGQYAHWAAGGSAAAQVRHRTLPGRNWAKAMRRWKAASVTDAPNAATADAAISSVATDAAVRSATAVSHHAAAVPASDHAKGAVGGLLGAVGGLLNRKMPRREGPIGAALSSEAATERILSLAGLQAGMGHEGLGEVTTAEAFHAALPPGEAVWLTFSNKAYLHFAQNWYMSVRHIGRHRQVIVAALDPATLGAWRSLRVPVLDYSEFGDSSDFRGIGSDQARFRKMGAMKVAAFLQLLKLGRTVLVSDVDTVWTADPQPFFERRGVAADISVSSDCLSKTADQNKRGDSARFDRHGVWFCGHNPGNTFGATFNTGVLHLTPTAAAIEFTRRWHDLLLQPTEDWHMEDQRGFNMLVMEHFYPTLAAPGAHDGSVVLAANGTLRLMPLPAARFCSGHTFFVQQSGRAHDCLNVHVTFTEGGVHGKLWRLKEAGMWYLEPPGTFEGRPDPSTYDTGSYLTIRPPQIPHPLPPARIEPVAQCRARLAAGGEPSPTYHGWVRRAARSRAALPWTPPSPHCLMPAALCSRLARPAWQWSP